MCVAQRARRVEYVLPGGLASSFQAGFSELLVGARSNLDVLHLGSARYGLL